MKDLGSEMCHFGCLLEGDLLKIFGILHCPRVSCADSVNVCPDLDALSVNRHTDERGRVIGTASSEDCLLAGHI